MAHFDVTHCVQLLNEQFASLEGFLKYCSKIEAAIDSVQRNAKAKSGVRYYFKEITSTIERLLNYNIILKEKLAGLNE